jgi:plasmid stabilization system protein ParE
MIYRVELTARAEADIDRIFAWLSERSQEGADRWYESFWNSAARLKTLPHASGFAPESGALNKEVRQMLFGTKKGRTYRALFIISGEVIRILCVRGPGERLLAPDELMN